MHATNDTLLALARQISPMPQRALWPTPTYLYLVDPQASVDGHDLATKARVAEALAEFLGYGWAGSWRAGEAGPLRGSARYLVPSDAIVGLETSRELGLGGIDDLFGGVVPHDFVATKLITHPLLRVGSPAPQGWSTEFGERTADAVLPGYSVFSIPDALEAGASLLRGGSLRIKHPQGVGGNGQWVARSSDELRARLAAFPADDLLQHGLVLERNLRRVTTLSVGQVQVGRLTISYHGTQSLTVNHAGREVYGGSRLRIVRGAFEDLLQRELPPAVRPAVLRAVCYHHAAISCFPGLFASRSNYDVARGVDDSGHWHCGVLEQSWRIGGASGAEVSALRAFDADPGLTSVVATTTERYGADVMVPAGAWLLYDGVDPTAGRLVKYAQVEEENGCGAGRDGRPGMRYG
jgi:hypothetical protein